jgi:hypothetical protein
MKKNCVICDAEFEGRSNAKYCSPKCKQVKATAFQREWTRKNKDRLNAERRAKVREQLGIKYCITCDNEIPYENNMSYSKKTYCSHECFPSSQKEYKRQLSAKLRAKRGPKISTEKEKQWQREYYQRNKEKIRERQKAMYYNRTEEQKERQIKLRREWNSNRTQEQRDKMNKWRRKNRKRPEIRAKERQELRDWHKKNPHKNREYYEELRKDPLKVLHQRMSNAVRNALRHKGSKKVRPVFDLLDYTKDELETRFESQFTEENGYSWDNMSEWHIDHIRPVASFNFDSTEHPDFKKCWALNNLQPLWAEDNIRKGNKWDGVTNA